MSAPTLQERLRTDTFAANFKKAGRILTKIHGRTGGELRVSRRGVPHLVVGGQGGYSACYFAGRRRVLVWDAYATGLEQRCWTFQQWPEAARFINDCRRFLS